ncbi:MAG: type IV secretion system DNA-binding domain-containing protein [Thermodesulfovibrio sp.]|nr:type IV secretion system DNA-binding domain-containing protein [Thermodesulfovibrio sp.]MDW7972434.1 type IV secretion system DNA-binding domain-containing protein [Thermodesulfovibrio sp.]
MDLSKLIHIGKIPVPPWAETRHFLIVGRPGTGKTTLLNQVLEVLRKRGNKAIIHDFKGDYLSYFYDPDTDIIFNPLDSRSVNWCLFSEIEMMPDVDSIATSMIPESFREDKFWIDAARDVFSSIIYYLKMTKQETNQAIWEHVTKTEQEMLQLMQQAVASGVEHAKKALGYLQGYEKGSKVASDVLSTMRQYTNCFQYMTHLQSDFSIKKWLENDSAGFIFITNYANLRDTLKPILSLFIDTALKHLLSLTESRERRVFFILDEFASLQRLTSIVRTLEQGRSKGASVWIATQDISQLQKLYSHETANTIANTTNTIVSFALNDPNSCEYMSKVFGETEILETDESVSMGPYDVRDGLSITRRRKTERLLLPSQFTLLKDLECYLKMLSYEITKTKINFKRHEQKNISFILNERFRF